MKHLRFPNTFSIKMRTSSTQFEIMLNYMEQNGDLNKFVGNNIYDRVQEWEKLATLLNSDPSGVRKPTEKWKKIWSDLKYNTKRKAMRIWAMRNSGHTKLTYCTSLTDFEERVLNVDAFVYKSSEACKPEDNMFTQHSDISAKLQSPQQDLVELPAPISPVFIELADIKSDLTEVEAQSMAVCINHEWEQPSPLRQSDNPPSPISTQSSCNSESVIPDIEGQIPKYEGRPKLRNNSKIRCKKIRKRQADKSTERLLKYLVQKGQAEIEIEKERLRLREKELNIQQKWQEVAVKAIDALHKVIDNKIN